MGIGRRGFIKIAGLTAIAGALGKKPGNVFANENILDTAPTKESLVGQRWAMVVDLRKCLQEKGCTKCMDACHKVHNVPSFDNPKDEIKWIWKESFEHTFEEQEHEYTYENIQHSPIPVLCNHCDNPPCVRVCPTQATFKRDDGIVIMDLSLIHI